MAAVQMYRVFNLREAPAIMRGRYAKARLQVPTRMLFGTDDTALRPELLAGYERHADDMELELVHGCGHFIADERPELVAERAREFFAEVLEGLAWWVGDPLPKTVAQLGSQGSGA